MNASKLLRCAPLVASALILACGGNSGTNGSAGQSVTVEVSPRTVSVAEGDALQLSASVYGTSSAAVTWSVTEGAAGGAVDASGTYVAPMTPGTYHVVATSVADGSRSASAVITVTPAAVDISVSPPAATVSPGSSVQLVATVNGQSGVNVVWSVDEGPAGGTVTSTGVYTAPSTPGTYTVSATPVSSGGGAAPNDALVTSTSSTYFSSKSRGHSRITVAAPVGVTVSPSTASTTTGATLQLTATVANASDTSVTWSVQEGAAGGAVDPGGAYSAPATPGTYHVVATSVADPTASGMATVTVSDAAALSTSAVSVSVNPPAATLPAGGSITFSASVANSTNQGVTWSVQEGGAGGSITASGVYVAPGASGTYHVIATSVAVPAATATATVTVALPVTITVNPVATTVVTGGSVAVAATVTNASTQAVTWSVQEGASGGTITAAGVYTAPSTPGTYHVVATSQADATKTAISTMTVTSPPVSITSSPTTASVATGGTVNFTASVGNTSNQGVTWSVQEGASGGTITAAGVYTAPSAGGTYHVIAASQADPTKTAASTVTVTAPASVSTSAPASSCAAEPLRTTGPVYYFCNCDAGADAACTNGNDASAGTSPSSPWQSWSKMRSTFTSMPGGATVALCKGGSWNVAAGSYAWGNASCSPGSTCDLRDYQASWGGTSKPRIVIPDQSDSWAFSISNASGLRFFNVAITGAQFAFVTWGHVNNVDVCNVTFTDGDISLYTAVSDSTTHHIALRQSTITNMRSNAYLGACDYCSVDSNYFANNGTSTSYRDHNVYVGQNPLSDGSYYLNTGMRVTNNELTGSSSSAYAPCGSVELTVHGSHSGLVIENNYIHEPPGSPIGGCYGISVGSGLDVVARFPGLVVRRNRVFNVGNVGIEVAEAPNAVVEDNIVAGTGGQNDAFIGIRVGEACTSAPAGSACMTGATFRNNTVFAGAGAHGGRGVALNSEGTGHIVTGNVVVSYGDQTQAAWSCYANDLPASSYALIDRNACWFAAGGVGTGAGTNLVGGGAPPSAVFVNAGTDPAGADFTPGSGSPLIGASSTATNCTVGGVANQACSSTLAIGTALWSPLDAGAARSSPPDVGARVH